MLSVVWGTSFLFIKIGLDELTPLALVSGRFFVALVALVLITWRQGDLLPQSKREAMHLAFVGLVNTALPIFLISWGELSVDSGLTAVLNGTVPIWTIMLAHLLLHDERFTKAKVLGVWIGFIGLIVLVGGVSLSTAAFWGQMAVVCGSISYALGSVYVRRHLPGVAPTRLIFFSLVVALLAVAPLTLVTEGIPTGYATVKGISAILWLGVLGTALAYQLYYRLLHWWGAGRSTTVTYVAPVVGLTLGAIFLDEQLTFNVLLGSGLILLGVILANSNLGKLRNRR